MTKPVSYRAPQKTLAGADNQYMHTDHPTFQWVETQRGGFTAPVLVNSGWNHGECKPVAIGGDTENREVGGIRHSANVDAVGASLLGGQLDKLNGALALWPNSSAVAYWPNNQTVGVTKVAAAAAARLVTVYADDGTVLA